MPGPRQQRKPNSRLVQQRALKDRLRKKIAQKQGPKKICLTAIMRNESKNIYRLLDSLYDSHSKSYVMDMISIVDTGSEDNTKELILQWGQQHNIPTTVHFEPFKNFGYNRSHSVKMAKQTYPEADYFLLTDADFIWEVGQNGKFDKTLLVDHKYLIDQYNQSLTYANIRMLSAKVDWTCYGVTHEFWGESKNQEEYAGEVRSAKIRTLKINDLEDGGHKADKFIRDERLLREGLEDPDEPENMKTRYKFYLGQTLKDMGRHEESIQWYNKRIEKGGWPEEVYYAKFQIGFNYEQMARNKKWAMELIARPNKTQADIEFLEKWNPDHLCPSDLKEQYTKHFTEASVSYMAAYKYRSTRAEALYYLTRMYRNLGMNREAYELAVLGNKIKYPDDSLFIERGCYDYLFDFEISIVAFYLNEYKDEGREALSRLASRNDLPEWVKRQVEANCKHYI